MPRPVVPMASFAPGDFPGGVERRMVRQNQRARPTDPQSTHNVHAQIFHALHFGMKSGRRQYHTVPNQTGDIVAQNT